MEVQCCHCLPVTVTHSPTERWGWTPVSLKINTRHTLGLGAPRDSDSDGRASPLVLAAERHCGSR
jgi:hypothetical protein